MLSYIWMLFEYGLCWYFGFVVIYFLWSKHTEVVVVAWWKSIFNYLINFWNDFENILLAFRWIPFNARIPEVFTKTIFTAIELNWLHEIKR